MADFAVHLQSLKLSFSASTMNPNMAVVNNLTELVSFNPTVHELMSLPNEGFSDHQRSQHPLGLISNDIPNASHHHHQVPVSYDPVAHFFPVSGGPSHGACNNPNALSESDSLVNSSPQGSGIGVLGNNKTSENYNHIPKKRKRNGDREAEKPREVVHVRAKRGQATDSHSLAERLRREKINEKLRCLQDLVPGCYKTMGMAVMLDVIINYVRSLQNQIDFLSMKLSAASLFYDFNSSDMDTIGTIHGMNGFEAQGMEKMMGEGYGVLPAFHPLLASLIN